MDPEAGDPSSALGCHIQRARQKNQGPVQVTPLPPPNASYLDSFPATVLVCGLCRPVWVILAGHTQPLQKPISETIVRAAGEVFPAGSKDSLVKTKETG